MMNIDTLVGEGTEMKGRLKEGLGNATGDPALQTDGAADQLSGQLRKAFGALRDLARDQPVATLAVAGLFAVVLFRGASSGRRGA